LAAPFLIAEGIIMKVLVAGGTGQVGRELSQCLADELIESIPLSASGLDITHLEDVQHVLDTEQPNFVVNTAAYTHLEQAEQHPEACYVANRDGPKNLAMACAERNIPLLHLSSDYVFDGAKSGAYTEDDEVAPIGVYGDSKWQGEEAIREHCDQHIIFRVSWVFSSWRNSFIRQVLRAAKDGSDMAYVADKQGCPTPATDIARVVLAVLKQLSCGAQVWGTYHYCGADVVSRHGFVEAVLAEACAYEDLSQVEVAALNADDAVVHDLYPVDAVLDCRKLFNTFGIKQRPWRGALTELVKELYQCQ